MSVVRLEIRSTDTNYYELYSVSVDLDGVESATLLERNPSDITIRMNGRNYQRACAVPLIDKRDRSDDV